MEATSMDVAIIRAVYKYFRYIVRLYFLASLP